MAKLTKGVLKQLMKECLLEILQEEKMVFVKESVVPGNQQLLTAVQKDPSNNKAIQSAAQQKESMLNDAMQESIQNLSNTISKSTLGGDTLRKDLFAEIFEDTAKTTLLERQVFEGNAQPSPEMEAQYEMQNNEELEKLIPSGDINRWASVAFSGKDKK